ncbi:MAG: hypothetical protein V3S68_05215, partial [Dehalococcoidia bacterium]
IESMAEAMGVSAASIVNDFERMRMEGETWKDLLLRLDAQGVISMQNLAAAISNVGASVSSSFSRGSSGGGVHPRDRNTETNLLRNLSLEMNRQTGFTNQASPEEQAGIAAQIARTKEQLRAIGSTGFEHGGVVPGRLGEPLLATVHGGETVIPAGGGGGTTIIFQGDVFGFEDFERRVASISVRQQRRGAA